MEKKTLIYCYDAYCGWCYGFSPVIKKISEEMKDQLEIEVLSGGMIIGELVQPIEKVAGFISNAYKEVEQHTGIVYGRDYLWHIENPQLSDWYMNSEKPAVAMVVFKEYYPELQVAFAADLQYALHVEGRDLCDDEAYRHLLEKYGIREEAFYEKLKAEAYIEQAHYEFALCKQLNVTGFPALLLQENESRFHLLARGYTAYDDLKTRLDEAMKIF